MTKGCKCAVLEQHVVGGTEKIKQEEENKLCSCQVDIQYKWVCM